MTSVPDAGAVEDAVRQLELTVTRRLSGVLQGDHLGLLPGPGSEPGEGRAYVPGDEVRHIDWSLTARSDSTQVRDRVADRELQAWLVVDCSASLDFGTAMVEKRELAVAAAAVFGFLAVGGGNRVGAALARPDGVELVPARSGRDHVRQLLLRLHRRERAGPGPVDLAGALDRVDAVARHRGLVVVVSDMLDVDAAADDLAVRLRRLGLRHDLTVVEVRDPRDAALPAVGLITLVDPETDALLEVQTDDARVRERFAAAAADQRSRVAALVRGARGSHLVLSTDEDWLPAFVRHVALRRRARR